MQVIKEQGIIFYHGQPGGVGELFHDGELASMALGSDFLTYLPSPFFAHA